MRNGSPWSILFLFAMILATIPAFAEQTNKTNSFPLPAKVTVQTNKIVPLSTNNPAKIDINSADAKLLETLPGIGPSLAAEIIKQRPFRSVSDLERVKGIGPARIKEIAPFLRIGGIHHQSSLASPTKAVEKRMDLNHATQAELEALPRIGPHRAKLIIAARPFRTIQDVMKIKGIKEAEFNRIKDFIMVK
ncbi:MAG: helix-hairpin-helix domain-containing protein [Verrucomicrobiota bacterium]|nr:helix-hairpin-helix domain-containing protein [Verrucomicrobiota bacterium]